MREYHVISHTHWDREWYQPHERFRLRLVDLIDRLIDILESDSRFVFHLDAQTIVLDDYLEVRPWRRNDIERYVVAGRILTGPWYVQNDFYLTSGEATIRNLLHGTRAARTYGESMDVGYMPDQFGLIGQLPQILKGFGIDNALFGRGYAFPERKRAEFLWRAPDGSTILAVNMPFWYNNAQRFPADPAQSANMLSRIREHLETTSGSEHYLLMNGVDHLEAQEDLLPILEGLGESLASGERIFQSTLPQYMARLREAFSEREAELEHHTGELRFGIRPQILAGTLSSRASLKRMNFACQQTLERMLEPLFSTLVLLGIDAYPRDQLALAWRTLLQNHPHDDICGCSIDSVHRHMVDRFERVTEMSAQLEEQAGELLCDHIDRAGLPSEGFLVTVANTLPYSRNEVVEATVDVPVADESRGIELRAPDGTRVPSVLKSTRRRARGVLSRINLPGIVEVDSYTVSFLAKDIPGCGYVTYCAIPTLTDSMERGTDETGSHTIENDYLRATVNADGTVDLEDLENGVVYAGLFPIDECADGGDSYIFREIPDSGSCSSRGGSATIGSIERDRFGQHLSVTYSFPVPAGLDQTTRERLSDTVMIDVRLELMLVRGRRWLDVSFEVENRARDHRVRVLIPTGADTTVSHASEPFELVERDRALVDDGTLMVPEQPTNGLIAAADEARGLAVLTQGQYEYEHFSGTGTLALTLFRGTGFISNNMGALPMDESWVVPENQCLGTHRCLFSIMPCADGIDSLHLADARERYADPVRIFVAPVERTRYGGGRPFVQDDDLQAIFYRPKAFASVTLPRRAGTVQLEGDPVSFSILKAAEEGDGLVLRLYNPFGRELRGRIVFDRSASVAAVDEVSLNEEVLRPVPVDGSSGNSVDATIPAGKIVSYRINTGRR